MNKSELISAIVDKAGLAKKDADKALNAFIEIVTEELKAGGKVQLVGFGTFEVKTREAHAGRNPATGESIMIPASKHPTFSAGKSLKDALK